MLFVERTLSDHYAAKKTFFLHYHNCNVMEAGHLLPNIVVRVMMFIHNRTESVTYPGLTQLHPCILDKDTFSTSSWNVFESLLHNGHYISTEFNARSRNTFS